MSYHDITYEVVNNVARITTNRPRYRNAQSRRLLEELDDAFRAAGDDREVHVIALFGAGEHFSGGHDLGTPDEMADRRERPIEAGLRGRFRAIERAVRSTRPCVGATSRNPRLPGSRDTASTVAGSSQAPWTSSMPPTTPCSWARTFQFFSVPWDMHPRKAKELLFESRFIDAREAMDLGLVNRVFPTPRLHDEVLAYAERIARNDPFQLRMIKLAVNQVQDTQGFHAHITAAHLMHMASAEGERDPDYALKVPEGRRRPMVERAFEHYQLNKDRSS